jgi:hypothetical protein
MTKTPGNDPALLVAKPADHLRAAGTPGANLAAEVARTDAAVARAAAALGFFDEPAHYPVMQGRLA